MILEEKRDITMKHDKYCMNKADPTLQNCSLCGLIRRVRADEYEVGFRDGYNKGVEEELIRIRMNK